MAKKSKNNCSEKHKKDTETNPVIVETLIKNALEGKMPCAVAFKIAEELDVTPVEVGVNLDLLGIKISKCQLGIFGYGKGERYIKPMNNVPPPLEKAIREILTKGRITCRDAWQTAVSLGTGRTDVASACEGLGIKISSCQLGAF